jgi:hypothetical protein
MSSVNRDVRGFATVEGHGETRSQLVALLAAPLLAAPPHHVDGRDAELDAGRRAVLKSQVNLDVITVPVAIDVTAVERSEEAGFRARSAATPRGAP